MGTNIEWADETWPAVTGCSRTSPGCGTHLGGCYAEKMAWRLSHNPATPQYQGTVRMTEGGPRWTGKVQINDAELLTPLHWKKPRKVFVCSMSDLFHESLPDEDIDKVFATMLASEYLENRTSHVYQVLTKRAKRLAEYFSASPAALLERWSKAADGRIILDNPDVYFSEAIEGHCSAPWGPNGNALAMPKRWSQPENLFPLRNVWIGVSCEDRKHGLPRLDYLRRVPAAVRWVSFEPLLEDLGEVDLTGIDWGVAGAESGTNARPMEEAWVASLRDQHIKQGKKFLYKQRMDGRRKVSLPLLDGRRWVEFPEAVTRAEHAQRARDAQATAQEAPVAEPVQTSAAGEGE